MLRLASLCLGAVVLLNCSGCLVNLPTVVGSGAVVDQAFEATDFDQIEVHSTFDVAVRLGPMRAVEVSADDNLMEYIEVKERGRVLEIGLSRNIQIRDGTLRATVMVPRLTAVSANGASKVLLDDLECEDLRLEIHGASRARGVVTTRQLQVSGHGASSVELAGKVDRLSVDMSGASNAKLEELLAASCSADVSGASTAHVYTVGVLEATASGASTVTYNQGAHTKGIRSSGASNVRQR
jgi:hypothetical protein